MWRIMLVCACMFLSGCESVKYYECLARDSTSRPCN